MHSSNTVVPKSTTPRMLESECHHQASAGGEKALHVDLAHTNSTYAQTANHEVVSLQMSATSVRPANNPSLLKVCEAMQSSPRAFNQAVRSVAITPPAQYPINCVRRLGSMRSI